MHTRQVRKWMEIYWPKKSCSLLWLLVGCHFYAANDTSFLVCLSLYLFPFVSQSFCLSVFLTHKLFVCLSVCLYFFLCFDQMTEHSWLFQACSRQKCVHLSRMYVCLSLSLSYHSLSLCECMTGLFLFLYIISFY